MTFFQNHPILAVSVFGSLIGTLLSYIAPSFTRDYLCADEDFTIGNLGLAVFVHNGVAHYIGNLIFMTPGALLCEAFYDHYVILAVMIAFAFIDCMLCIPLKRASCGYSGVSYLLCSMACFHGMHWWGILIFGFLFVTSLILDHGGGIDVFSHVLGFLAGGSMGMLLNFQR